MHACCVKGKWQKCDRGCEGMGELGGWGEQDWPLMASPPVPMPMMFINSPKVFMHIYILLQMQHRKIIHQKKSNSMMDRNI